MKYLGIDFARRSRWITRRAQAAPTVTIGLILASIAVSAFGADDGRLGATRLADEKLPTPVPPNGAFLPPPDFDPFAVAAPQPRSAPPAPHAAVSCNGAGGLWNTPSTWSGGFVPSFLDAVTINTGCTVIVDTAAQATSIVIQNGGLLEFESATARTIFVTQSITIDAGGILRTPNAGTITTHGITVSTDLINNGTLDLSTNGNAAGAILAFQTAGNATFGGTGATTDLRTLVISKGSSRTNILEITTSNLSVQGSTVDGTHMAFVTLTNGTLKISGTFTMASRLFPLPAGYGLPTSTGLWLNNPNFTIAGQNGSPTNFGQIRLSAGTYNIGTSAGNSMGAGSNASFVIEGGTMNVAGRLSNASVGVVYAQSGGTVNVATVGNAASVASFGLTSNSSLMYFTGGTINLVQACTGVTPIDYSVLGTMVRYTGGTLNVGTPATATNFLFRVQGQVPALVTNNVGSNKNVALRGPTDVWGDLTINPGTTLTLGIPGLPDQTLTFIGSTLLNRGAIAAAANNTGTVNFAGVIQQALAPYSQAYNGTGTFGAGANRVGTVAWQNPAGVTISATALALNAYRANAFCGLLTNASKLALGAGDGTTVALQRGFAGNAVAAGSLDSAPVYNIGAGGFTAIYSQSSTPITTSFEIPATRVVSSLQIVNPTGVTIAGGGITANGAVNALLLQAGVLTTSVANLLTIGNTLDTSVSGGNTNSYVSGPLARTLPASAAGTLTWSFPVGKGSFKMFELTNVATTAGGTVVVQAEAFDADAGGIAGAGFSSINTNRYWSAAITAGAANFTSANVRLTEQGTPGANAIGQSATQTGAYNAIGGAVAAPTIGPSTTAVSTLGYFAVGVLTGAPTLCGLYVVSLLGGDFASVNAAVTAWNTRIATCPVTFALQDTAYSTVSPITIQPNGGSSATNTLTIKAATSGITVSTASASAVLILNGVDYVTIDGSQTGGGTSRDLTITTDDNSASSAMIWGQSIGTSDGATNNTIKNLNLRGNTGFVGIGFGSDTISTASLGSRNDGNRIQNNLVTNVQYGIYTQGAASVRKNAGNVIVGNELGSSSFPLSRVGIFAGFEDGITITGNTVQQVTSNGSADVAGIALGSLSTTTTSFGATSDVASATVTGNSIGSVVQTGDFSALGILLPTTLNGATLIANNMVSGVVCNATGARLCAGILVGNAGANLSSTSILDNSVSMTGDRDALGTPPTGPSYALAVLGAFPNLDMRGNALFNSQTTLSGGPGGTAGSYAIGLSSAAPLLNVVSNFNDLYTSGPASHFAALGSLAPPTYDVATLGAWQAATGKDSNSISADPLFTSTTDLHIDACAGLSPLLAAGTPLPVLVDFDGDTRPPTSPNIGADETRRYAITSSAGAGGTIVPNGITSVIKNCNASYTITPNACQAIADVLVDGLSVGAVTNYTFTNVQADHTIVASFAPATYVITASAGTGGSITPSGSVPVACNASQGFVITPASCYAIDDVLVDGLSVGPVANYTFNNVTANHTIAASFVPSGSVTISASAGAGGSMTPSGASIVACGGDQAYVIVPNLGFAIADVTVDAVSVGTPTTYTFLAVDDDHTISATFRGIVGEVPDRDSLGFPLLVTKNGGDPSLLNLTWGDSCGAVQSDFALYEGTLGTWYSHQSRLACTTGGGFSVSAFPPMAGDAYYLVVPLSSTDEGSYGKDSAGAQIPPGSGVCFPTQDTTCCAATKLIGHWRFDEAGGGTAYDSTGNSLHGTLYPSTTHVVPSTAPMTGGGNALAFGALGYVSVVDSPLFAALANALTIEAWIYDTDGADNAIIDHSGNDFLLSSHPNGSTGLGFLAAGGWTYSAGTIPTNQWVHVAVTMDGTTMELKFYMNGTLISSHVRSQPIFVNVGFLNIGRENPNGCQCHNFSGTLDEVRLWTVVRTQAEIQATMGAPLTCP